MDGSAEINLMPLPAVGRKHAATISSQNIDWKAIMLSVRFSVIAKVKIATHQYVAGVRVCQTAFEVTVTARPTTR